MRVWLCVLPSVTAVPRWLMERLVRPRALPPPIYVCVREVVGREGGR